MKQKFVFALGIIGIVFVMAACDTSSDTGDTGTTPKVPKEKEEETKQERTITINNINFTNGTEVWFDLIETNNFSGSEYTGITGNGTISNNTITVTLYDSDEWFGSGSFFAGIKIHTSEKPYPKTYISKRKITFSDDAPDAQIVFPADFEQFIFKYKFGNIANSVDITTATKKTATANSTVDFWRQQTGTQGPIFKDAALTQPFSNDDILSSNTDIFVRDPRRENTITVTPAGMTLDAWCSQLSTNDNLKTYAALRESGYLPGRLYRNETLTQEFAGNDTLLIDTDIYSEFDLMKGAGTNREQIGALSGTITLLNVSSPPPQIYLKTGGYNNNGSAQWWSDKCRVYFISDNYTDISWSIPIYKDNDFFPVTYGRFYLYVKPDDGSMSQCNRNVPCFRSVEMTPCIQ